MKQILHLIRKLYSVKHLSWCRFTSLRRKSDVLQGQGTIFALSSGHGKAGVAIIRVSGSLASESLRQMIKKVPPPRTAVLRKISHPLTSEAIDNGLILWFPGPSSFTGEDCAEFQVHGGSAVVAAMLTALDNVPGLRHAQPGEFTKRAFMNGRLDLTEVEGLADLISAETEAQRRQALRQMQGELGHLYTKWRTNIIKCQANIEAYIDFSEDENIEEDVIDYARSEVEVMLSEMKGHLHDNRRGERLRSGVHVAIIGEPNVGKSSLLNALCQRPAAIVSPIPGTTRDIVETALNIGGYPVLVSDTAGLRTTQDEVEREGIRRAVERAQEADIKILLVEASTFSSNHSDCDIQNFVERHLNTLGIASTMDYNSQTSSNYQETADLGRNSSQEENVILVFNKTDLMSSWKREFKNSQNVPNASLSCSTGSGMKEFVELLAEKIKHACGDPLSGNPSLTQTRHRHHLSACVGHLENFLLENTHHDVVMAAHQLRKASRQLAKISGAITSEDILDVIFKDFCIGK